MKTIKLLSILFFSAVLFTACSDEDPIPVLEEEMITNVNLTFTNAADANDKVVLSNVAPNGQDGTSTYNVEGKFKTGATYSLTLELLNGDEDVLTEDIIPEAAEHFFWFKVNGINLTMTRDNDDTIGSGGSKLGVKTTWVAGAVSSGNVQIALIHEPDSTDDSNEWGTVQGGSEDINLTFTGVKIE
ncbi:hypothetical protein SAMN04489761_0586 [Tenacibaculum sp. MAR_2009_124]|uniref:hypothetical protein n=1 Tax=Tenacibaculum sp. MAR_2009_124 TaxID=1250059 RepID=UPI000897D794|nr:hypothetical protein [Tenacibaculum sp. MAR_2009_124]SEB41749.1 hypothetical protein SAMN04489761_0586 [Tenacibaculum sp. MAR_2009_124]